MKCYHCNAELSPTAKFYGHCGKEVVIFCTQCGRQLPLGTKFCPGCGAKVEELKEEKNTEVDEASAEEQELPSWEPEQSSAQPECSASQTAPVQPAPVQTPASVSHTAPVTPQVPVAPVASAVSSVAAEVTHAAGAAAVAGVKKTVSTGKKIAIAAAVVAFVIGAIAACLNFFVPAPHETVDKLVSSVEELDYDKMLSCFDSTTEKQIRAVMGLAGDLMGSLTGISMDLEDLMALAPSMADYLEIPDLGIVSAETVLYADCSEKKIMEYCVTANNGGEIPSGYLADNEIVSFLMEYKIALPGLENLIAKTAIVKITLDSGDVGYLPLVNEGWGDWRIPIMDLATSLEGLS